MLNAWRCALEGRARRVGGDTTGGTSLGRLKKNNARLASATRVEGTMLSKLMPWARAANGVENRLWQGVAKLGTSVAKKDVARIMSGPKRVGFLRPTKNNVECCYVNKKCEKNELIITGNKTFTKKVNENVNLQSLAAEVPHVLLGSHAVNTNKAYKRIFDAWVNWASKMGVRSLPAEGYFVALFLIEMGQNTGSAANIRGAIPAICWGHRMAGVEHNLETQFIKDIAVGLRRKYAKPRKPKEVFSSVDLIKCVELADLSVLKELRSITIMVLSFTGFFRFDEVSKLKWADICFKEGYVEITVRKSKTDQLREGNKVLIAQAVSKACAVNLLKKYLIVSEGVLLSESYVFRALNNRNGLRMVNKPMSYTSVRELIAEQFVKIGLDAKLFGLHSLRAGGATEAANNHVSDRLFRRHGRWACDASKDLYIKDNLSSLLSVTKSLGL